MAIFGNTWSDDSDDRKIGPMSSWVNDELGEIEEKDEDVSLFSRWKEPKLKIRSKKDAYDISFFNRWKK